MSNLIDEDKFDHILTILMQPEPDLSHASLHLSQIVVNLNTMAQVIGAFAYSAASLAKNTDVFDKHEGGFYAQVPPEGVSDPAAALRVCQILNAYLNDEADDARTLTIGSVTDPHFGAAVLSEGMCMFAGTARLVHMKDPEPAPKRRWWGRKK